MIKLGQKSTDLQVSDIPANAKFTQLDKHQIRMAEVPSSVLTWGNFVADFFFTALMIILNSHLQHGLEIDCH